MDFGWVFTPSGWIALATLTAMEIVLGIDNVIFVSLIGARLPPARARIARFFGLGLAFAFRVASLAGLTWLIALTRPIVTVWGHPLSWRDLVLIAAGLFLMVQATLEIHAEMDDDDEADSVPKPQSLGLVVLNIAVMDLVFSFDSILTAIGIARDLAVMVVAILISIAIMFVASAGVARFIRANPTSKVLALCFLVLIGLSLVAEGTGLEVPHGYLYFAMLFSAGVEVLNIWARRNRRRRRAAASGAGHP